MNTEIRCWGCGTFLSVYVNRGIVVVASKGIEEKITSSQFGNNNLYNVLVL